MSAPSYQQQIDDLIDAAEALRQRIKDDAGPITYGWYRTSVRELAQRTGLSKSVIDRVLRDQADFIPPALRTRACRRRVDVQVAGQMRL